VTSGLPRRSPIAEASVATIGNAVRSRVNA
jgi:hypothetical protein